MPQRSIEGAMMVTTREVTCDVDGLNTIAYLAQPDSPGPWPAVLIGHDGVGLEEYQRQRADDLAAHGYLALAMDYHAGEVFFNRPDAMLNRVMPLLANVERMQAIGRAGLDVLLAQPGVDPNRIAALGFGAGGQIVLELARTGFAFRAIAVVHSALPDAKTEDWTEVTSTVLMCTGSEDPLCTPQQVLAFGHALQVAGVDWRVNIYGGAEHAFWARPRNPDGSPAEGTYHTMVTVPGVSHHPKHTTRAWRAVLDLFDEAF
jgi:dienelactone hydrolase